MPAGGAHRESSATGSAVQPAGLLDWNGQGYGGQGASPTEVAIFAEEAALPAPDPLNVIGLFLTGPTSWSMARRSRNSAICADS
jgi:hypothetical protein